MSWISTLLRATVMIATGFAVVKGWQQYGPSTEQVKNYAAVALEKAQAALNQSTPGSTQVAAGAADPSTASAPLAAAPMNGLPHPMSAAEAPQLVPVTEGAGSPFDGIGPGEAAAIELTAGASAEDPVAASLTRLHAMGGMDADVRTWGATGGFYRCSCQAKLSDSSQLARHFEAIANEPVAAVEQVAAKLEAWRAEQQGTLR